MISNCPIELKKSEMKTSSTPQTNWSHSLSRGTSTSETSLELEIQSSIDALLASISLSGLAANYWQMSNGGLREWTLFAS